MARSDNVASTHPRPRGARQRRSAELALAAVVTGLSACQGPAGRARIAGASGNDAERVVRDLWDAHGGLEALREPAAAVFAYTVESLRDGDAGRFDEVAIRLDDYRRIWVRPEGARELQVVELRDDLHWQSSPGIGCALASLRYLFSLPQATSRGGWEFRRLLTPGDVLHEEILEAAPQERGAVVGTCLLDVDSQTHRLAGVTYAPRHQFARGQPRRVRFDQYEPAGGLMVAMLRRGDLFRETLSNVRFLSRQEADELVPAP